MEKIIYLFSHIDLDGVGANILLHRFYSFEQVTKFNMVNCDYDRINELLSAFVYKVQNHTLIINPDDELYITDISPDDKIAQEVQSLVASNYLKLDHIHHFDHHATSKEYMDKYLWSTNGEDETSSGTSLLYHYLVKRFNSNFCFPSESIFVKNVTDYDTWAWTKNGNSKAKVLNDLFHLLGHEVFIKRFTNDISPELSPGEQLLLDTDYKNIKKYIQQKNSELLKRDIRGHLVGIVFGSQYISELGNTLAKNHPDVDYIAIINLPLSVSLRSSEDSLVDVGKIARLAGGGGHEHAAGFTIKLNTELDVTDSVFSSLLLLGD